MNDLNDLKKSSQRSAIISLIGILIFISSLLFASYNLYKANADLNSISDKLKISDSKLKAEEKKVEGLKHDESQLNEYVINLLNSTQLNQGTAQGNDINWGKIKSTITNLPSGKRKLALTVALLTTWKEIPFELNKNLPRFSFDSPGYMQYVLKQVGIDIQRRKDEPLSVTLMKHFEKTVHPLPGDLVFYKGETGNFGLIYISDNKVNGQGIAVGTLESANPLTIYNLDDINVADFPLIGYYRVNY